MSRTGLILFLVCAATSAGEPKLPLDPLVLANHMGEVTAVSYSPNGKLILTASYDGRMHLFEASNRKLLRTMNAADEDSAVGPFGILAATFSPDGLLIASAGAERVVRLWDTETGKMVRTLEGHKMVVGGAAFSPDGKTLATAGHDGTARLWDVRTGRQLHVLKGHRHRATAVVFSLDGKVLYTGGVSQNNRLLLCPIIESDDVLAWDVRKGSPLPRPGGKAHQLSMSSDGQSLVLCGYLATYTPGGDRGQIVINGLSIDSTTAVTILNPATGKTRLSMTGQGAACAFSANGTRAALAAGSLRLLERGEGSGTGNFLWGSGREQRVKVVDSRSSLRLLTLPGQDISALALAPDGSALVVGDSKGKVQFWDLTPGVERPGPDLSAKGLARLWDGLASDESLSAYLAETGLTVAGDKGVTFLTERLSPRAPVDPERLAALIRGLDAKKFAQREKASRELASLGPLAEPELRAVLRAQPSLEMRRRVELLLATPDQPPDTETLRILRAIDILETAATADACRLLERLANGARNAPETNAARDALARLKATRR